jgi:cobaltochelatase CobS
MASTKPPAPPADKIDQPDITVSVRQTFGFESEMQVPAFSRPSDHVPDLDEAYRFTATPPWRSWRVSPSTAG